MDAVYLLFSMLGGVLLGAIFYKSYLAGKKIDDPRDEAREEELLLLKQSQLLAEERKRLAEEDKLRLQEEIKELHQRLEDKVAQLARVSEENKSLGERFENYKNDFEATQKRLNIEFENIANKLLTRNSSVFVESNQKSMQEILSPLKEKIAGFEKRVEDTYEKGLKDQNELKVELLKLHDLNQKISVEANNLTNALKSDPKKQGNWGEVVLERVLERSGLSKGREYDREVVEQNSEGSVIRPDVVVNLPDDKHLIIDSKVSLTAYERYVNSEDAVDKQKAIREHILSIKNHIKGLSEKHYTSARRLNTPDFVLLFIPIESSFSVAIQEDQDLFTFAWEKKVVIVSPSTLLATLRTVASIWQQENQTRNAKEIARLSGKMYDKLSSFLTELDKIKQNLDRASSSYDEAVKVLSTGKGNMLTTAQKVRSLGAKNNKQLPPGWDDQMIEE